MQSSIFSGQVSHSRKTPAAHAFRYRVFMAYLDLDELDSVFKGRWFWSTKRAALARFNRANYFGDPAVPLKTAVFDLVEREGGARPAGPVRLLTNLSWFGYCFNPISLYYCFDPTDSYVETIVAEVSNTPWGERHCYVLADSMNTGTRRTRRFRTPKEMHVSPFMGMDMDYDWKLTEPGKALVVRIGNRSADCQMFGASLVLTRREITGRNLASVLLQYPFMTFRVMFGIHWQAFRLWLKGVPVQTHPDKKKSVQVSS